jgi:hypothetical protein
MPDPYIEMTLQGPRGWTLGWLQGRLGTEGVRLFDAEAEGFACAPMLERLHDLVTPSAEILHLLAPAPRVPELHEAVAAATGQGIALRILAEKPVRGTRFHFRLSIFSPEHGRRARSFFESLPPGVSLGEGTRFEEILHPEHAGVEAYAPVHDYELRAEGVVEGDLEGVLSVYRACRDDELIRQGPAELLF